MNFERAIEILNLTFDYTSEDLKKNYHLLMRKYHPDANIGKSEEDLKKLEEKAKEINEAYEFLLKRNKSRELEDIIKCQKCFIIKKMALEYGVKGMAYNRKE